MIRKPWLQCAAVAGSLAVLDYLTVQLVPLPLALMRILFFGQGPLLVVFAVALGRTMRDRGRAASLDLASVFGAIGGATFTLMAIVQNAIHATMTSAIAAAPDDASTRALRLAWRGLDSVQLGMDVVFDIFWLSALVLFGWNMLRDGRFGRILGASGAVLSIACLALNVWSFPTPPSPDLGPIIGVWGAAVMVQLWRALVARAAAGGSQEPARADTADVAER